MIRKFTEGWISLVDRNGYVIVSLRTLDIARTAYAGLPAPLRRVISPVVERLPMRLRYGATYRMWRERIAASRRDADICNAFRQSSLRYVLTVAVAKSPYYRDTVGGSGHGCFDVEQSLADWDSVPVINGRTVAAERDRMCVLPPATLARSSTGGSSGRPLSFYIEPSRSPVEYAFVMDAWSTVGMPEDEWHAVFRGFEIPDWERSPFEVEAALKELRFSVFHMSDALMPVYLAEIRRRGIRFIKGYPSALGALAACAIEQDLVDENVAGVLLHSEPVHDVYLQRLKRAFPNAVIRGFYGLSEKCAFATESEIPGEYEFNPIYGFTELLDRDNRPVTRPGERGRIVSTGLLFTGMPFIRYDTEDEAALVELPSRENGYRLRVAGIRPRASGAMLVARSRYLVESGSLLMMDDELDSVSEFQFEQSEPGLVEMRCVLFPSAKRDAIDNFAAMVSAKSRGEIEIKVSIVDRIPATMRGKRPLTVQRLDLSDFSRTSLPVGELERT